MDNSLAKEPGPSSGVAWAPLIDWNNFWMLAGSLTISVVPVSKMAAVFPITVLPSTEILLNDACQKP